MINSTFQSQFDDCKTLIEQTVSTTVEMEPSKLASKLAKELLVEMERIAPYAGYKPVSDLEEDDILKYCKTLIWLRCEIVSGFSKASAHYRPLIRNLAVPVMLYQMLIPIGIAIDRDYGIRFTPAYSIESEQLLDPDSLQSLSDIMTSLEASGLKIVYGLPKDRDGELDFMALCSVEGVVKGYRKAHPVYGFLASFFEQKKFNEITGAMCRIVYGYESDYNTYVSMVFRKINGPGAPVKVE